METHHLPVQHVWDAHDNFPSTTNLTVYPVRTKKPYSTARQARSAQKLSRHPRGTTGNKCTNQEQDLEQQWDDSKLMHATWQWQEEGSSPSWSISTLPSPGFTEAPLAYLAREMPLAMHQDLHAYHHQLIDSSAKQYATAAHHWIDLLWNVAQSHEVLLHGIISFARYQKSTAVARKSFLTSKHQIIRLISGRMQDPENGSHHDWRTVVAIALLAYSDMSDGDFQAAQVHLRALPLLSPPECWTPYEWVYVAWIDLRMALFLGQRPLLPYYIPVAFREAPTSMAQQGAKARKLALSNTKHGPRKDVDQAFTNVCFHMFSSLHEMGLAWNDLHQSGLTPYGSLYELEYSLRTMQDDLSTGDSPAQSVIQIKELILLCIQLQTWMIHRFWTPQRQDTYLLVLQRAQALLENLLDLPSQEAASSPSEIQNLTDLLDPTCLLWISFTLAGTAFEYGHPCQTLYLHILGNTAKSLQIKNLGDITRHLKKWPWLDNWHKQKLTLLWPRIRSLLGLPFQRWQTLLDGAADSGEAPVAQPPTSKEFFGGLEFYVDG